MAATQNDIDTYKTNVKTAFVEYGNKLSLYAKLGKPETTCFSFKFRLLKYFIDIIDDYFSLGTSYSTNNFFTTTEIQDVIEHINKICDTAYTLDL